MSEEEKRAINNMKLFARVHQDMTVVTAKEMDIVLKLVERLQRENEELNSKIPNLEQGTEILMETNTKLTNELNNSISKQKVNDKIEELNQYYKKEIYPSLYQWCDITITEHYDEMIELLQEILGDK